MRTLSPIMLTALIVAGMAPFSLQADYLKNSDLKEGIQCWHGDGAIAFLKADGTEGSEGDPDVTPVIKLALSHGHMRSVSQEFSVHDNPATLHFEVQIRASGDFKRSTNPEDYTTGEAPRASFVEKYDFWFYFSPYPFGDASMAKTGDWTTIREDFKLIRHDTDWTVNFCVPPGEGAIYIKNPVVERSP